MWPSQARILEISKRISGRIDASECECVRFLVFKTLLKVCFVCPYFVCLPDSRVSWFPMALALALAFGPKLHRLHSILRSRRARVSCLGLAAAAWAL